MASADTKTCTKCGETKPLTEYPKDSGKRDGRRSDCKACHTAQVKRIYHRDIEKARQAHKERQAKYRQADPEKHNAKVSQQRKANPTRHREYNKQWAKANPDKVREYKRRWDEANPDKKVDAVRRRRSRLAGRETDDYTRREIYDRDNGVCVMCGLALNFEPYGFEIDHIVPISLGGADTRANVQLACPPCNRKKSTRLEGQIHFAT